MEMVSAGWKLRRKFKSKMDIESTQMKSGRDIASLNGNGKWARPLEVVCLFYHFSASRNVANKSSARLIVFNSVASKLIWNRILWK